MRSVAAMYTYPVKSLRGISLQSAQVGKCGIQYDREWMVVDANTGQFLTQREIPKMALIETSIYEHLGALILLVRKSAFRPQGVPLRDQRGKQVEVTIWEEEHRAIDQGDGVAIWLTRVLEHPCRLVHFPEGHVRVSGSEDPNVQTRFADKWPFLIYSRETMAGLNDRLPEGVRVGDDRFRPNIVLAGCEEPHEEDRVALMQVDEVQFRGGTMCRRCTIPGVDQATGEQTGIPLATLRQYRYFEGRSSPKVPKTGIYFARNFDHFAEGTIKVGSPVEVLEWD